MSSAAHVVLLTGASGFVGKVVLETLLRRREELGISRVVALIRAGDPEHADARLRGGVFGSACFKRQPDGWEKRVEALAGDVTRPGLGVAYDARERVASEVTHVIHCAASVEFTLPLREALAVNTEGALHALEFARACPRLEGYVGVSTAYVTPHSAPYGGAPQRVTETLAPLPQDPETLYSFLQRGEWNARYEQALLAETGHPNTYTLSKCLAEHLVARRAGNLPLTLVRPSIISACRTHPMPGWIDSAAAFAGFVALIGTGKLRVLGGDPQARLDVVPCDRVAEQIVSAAFSPPRGELRIEHAVAGLAAALPLALCRERIVRHFSQHPAGGKARIDYLGPNGVGFRLADLIFQQLPALSEKLWFTLQGDRRGGNAVQKLIERRRALQRDFAYFTHASFDFETRTPSSDEPLEPNGYLDLVCEGVSRHLLRMRKQERRSEEAVQESRRFSSSPRKPRSPSASRRKR